MFSTLPKSSEKFLSWTWEQFKPYADELTQRPLNAAGLTQWLTDWSDLSRIVSEIYQRLYVAITVDTTDQQAEQRYNAFLEDVFPNALALDNTLKSRLLESGLQPAGFEQVLKNLRAEAEIFRERQSTAAQPGAGPVNSEYDKLIGAQTVEWEGKEVTLSQLQPVYQNPDRPPASRPGRWRWSGGWLTGLP